MYRQLQHSAKWLTGNRVELFVLIFFVAVLGMAVIFLGIKTIPGTTAIPFYCSIIFALLGVITFGSSFGRIMRLQKISNELRQQKELFRTTLGSISEGLIATGKNGEILYMNPAAEQMTGWKSSLAIKQPLGKVFRVSNEETGQEIDNVVNRVLRHGRIVEWENNTVLTSKGARKLIISNTGSPLVDSKGKLTGAVLVFNDTSGNKLIENKLLEREKQYRDLIQHLPEAVYTCDEFGYIQLYNKAAVRLWGREPKPGSDQWCGSWKMFTTDKKESPADACAMSIAIRESRSVHGEQIIIQRPDGSQSHVLPYPTPLYNAQGKLTGAVNMLIDITDKKEKEILVTQTEEKYRTLVEQASDGVIVYSFDGTIYDFNEAAHSHSGYTREEFKKLKLTDLLFDEPVIINHVVADKIKAGENVLFIRRLKKKDGTALEIELSTRMLPDGRNMAVVRDVTERKKAEKALRESEALNQSILTSITAHIAVMNENGTIEAVNNSWDNFSAQNGVTNLERTTKGSNYFDVCRKAAEAGDEIAASALAGILQVLRKVTPSFEIEYPCHSETEQRWFLLRVTSFAGNEPKVVLARINITERKKAEEALEQSNKRYELVAKSTSDMIWDWDLLTGKVYRSKEGWEEIFKENGDKEKGTEEDWESKIHPDDRKRVNQIKQEVFHSQDRNFFEIECRVLRSDGTYVHIHDKGYIIRNKEGKAIRLVGASSDITEKKLAEEELRSSEERYRHLFNNNPESIFIWDADNYKILEVNDTAVQEYGYQREEFVQLTTLDLRPPHEVERFKAFAKQMTQEPAKSSGIWRHLNKAGEEMFMSIVSDQVAYGNKTAILAIADNVTDKLKLQSKLDSERELRELEIKEAALLAQENERQEIGRELHDHINQLLATSRLYLAMLKKEKGSSPLMEETDNLIYSAITDIRSLSHSLIAPAVGESALEGILDDIIERIAATTEIIIHKNFSGFNENRITDKLKLAIYRIAQEQFNNIIKHARAKNVYLSLLEERNGIRLIIKDDGVGFDTNTRSAGVGLLNIRTRASLFNGEVSILSSPGNGCEVNIFFPVSNN